MDREKQDARKRMAITGEKYTEALRGVRLDAREEQAVRDLIWATVAHRNSRREPFLPPERVPEEERGWQGLGPAATPEQKAHAEAWWRPVPAGAPCPCTAPCRHGEPCENWDGESAYCPGRIIHTDRHPGLGTWAFYYPGSLSEWWDAYECDTCCQEPEGTADREVHLPDVPWAEETQAQSPEGPRHMILIYPGTRHFLSPDGNTGKPSSPLWDLSPGLHDDDLDPETVAAWDVDFHIQRATLAADPGAGLPGATAAVRAAIAAPWSRLSGETRAALLTRWTEAAGGEDDSIPAGISPLAVRLLQLWAGWVSDGAPHPGPGQQESRPHAVHAAEAAAAPHGEDTTLEAIALLGAHTYYRSGVSIRMK